MARLVSRLWGAVHRVSPRLVGGCRPLRLGGHLPPETWRVRHRAVVTTWGVASEGIVADLRPPSGPGASLESQR